MTSIEVESMDIDFTKPNSKMKQDNNGYQGGNKGKKFAGNACEKDGKCDACGCG